MVCQTLIHSVDLGLKVIITVPLEWYLRILKDPVVLCLNLSLIVEPYFKSD